MSLLGYSNRLIRTGAEKFRFFYLRTAYGVMPIRCFECFDMSSVKSVQEIDVDLIVAFPLCSVNKN